MITITDKTSSHFGFIVCPEANKPKIKSEVKALYGATVVDVSTIRCADKNKSHHIRAGIIDGRTNTYERAVVTLREGNTIDFCNNI